MTGLPSASLPLFCYMADIKTSLPSDLLPPFQGWDTGSDWVRAELDTQHVATLALTGAGDSLGSDGITQKQCLPLLACQQQELAHLHTAKGSWVLGDH